MIVIPQDPQVLPFRATTAKVLAETLDRGHRKNLGPAVVTRTEGEGRAIYIGSSLEAVYEETRMKVLRSWFASLLGPVLEPRRTYAMDYVPGVIPHLMASRDTLLLHLLADTGNKNKHLRVREQFLPVTDVGVKLRIPEGRTVKAVSLLRSGQRINGGTVGGWLDVTVPRVLIHEAVRVDLG